MSLLMPASGPSPAALPALRVGVAGDTEVAAVRRASLARIGVGLAWEGPDPRNMPALDVLFVATPPAERYADAREAVERGVAAFVEWPPAPALRNVQALGAAAEEAGTPLGVSRTLRFHPALATLDRPARLVVLRRVVPAGGSLLAGYTLALLADLCLFLAQGPALTRLDAQATRDTARAPRAVAFNLRFQNGAYAQASVGAGEAAALHLHATTATAAYDADLYHATDLDTARDTETRLFLDAVATRRPPPVTPLDALQTLRLAEKLWARLR